MANIYSVKELEPQYHEWVQGLNRACHIEAGNIEFDVEGLDTYRVPLSDCDTHAKILGWAIHLSEKIWISKDVLAHFMEIACEHHGLDAHAAPMGFKE